ncbi:MAG: VWA domain-containing protein [Blastocatellia bacterium]|nr:VWA domain-containing protein [Blastocatellia bacterium]
MRVWLVCFLVFLFPLVQIGAQSGRSTESGARHYSLNAIVQATGESLIPLSGDVNITRNQVALYEAGIEQDINGFRPDLTAARIVVVVDNSKGIPADIGEMEKATRALIGELFVGDRTMLVGFNDSPEMLMDFTEDGKKLAEACKLFTKKQNAHLYDALAAVAEDALRPQIGIAKRVIILISDGYDGGSQFEYERVLSLLQRENIVVYGLQIPDRTFGAPRAKKLGPKPVDAFHGLVEGTGGRVFKLDDAAKAAKIMTDEIRNRWYLIDYVPKGTNTTIARRLLVSLNDDKLQMRVKRQQPAN